MWSWVGPNQLNSQEFIEWFCEASYIDISFKLDRVTSTFQVTLNITNEVSTSAFSILKLVIESSYKKCIFTFSAI